MGDAYSAMAQVYDRLMSDVDYDSWLNFFLDKLPEQPRTAVDLACGTGRFTRMLARRGVAVQGCDLSPEMLSAAQEAARREAMRINFFRADIADFEIHRPVELLTCFNDGFNYITEKYSLRSALRCCRKALVPGGKLCFDISSLYKLSNILGSQTLSLIDDDLAYIWENEYDEEESTLDMELVFFLKNEHGTYDRYEESHLQRAWTVTEMIFELEDAGFGDIEVYGDFDGAPVSIDGNAQRYCYLATRL